MGGQRHPWAEALQGVRSLECDHGMVGYQPSQTVSLQVGLSLKKEMAIVEKAHFIWCRREASHAQSLGFKREMVSALLDALLVATISAVISYGDATTCTAGTAGCLLREFPAVIIISSSVLSPRQRVDLPLSPSPPPSLHPPSPLFSLVCLLCTALTPISYSSATRNCDIQAREYPPSGNISDPRATRHTEVTYNTSA